MAAATAPQFRFLSATHYKGSDGRDYVVGEMENISGETLLVEQAVMVVSAAQGGASYASTLSVKSLAPGDITAFLQRLPVPLGTGPLSPTITGDLVQFPGLRITAGKATKEVRNRRVGVFQFDKTHLTIPEYSPEAATKSSQVRVRGALVNGGKDVVPVPAIAVSFYNAAGEIIGLEYVNLYERGPGVKPGGRISIQAGLPLSIPWLYDPVMTQRPASFRISAFAARGNDVWVSFTTGRMVLPELAIELHTANSTPPLCPQGCLYGVVRNNGATAVHRVRLVTPTGTLVGAASSHVEDYIAPRAAVPFSIFPRNSYIPPLSLASKITWEADVTLEPPPREFATVGGLFMSRYGASGASRYQLNYELTNTTAQRINAGVYAVIFDGGKVVSLGWVGDAVLGPHETVKRTQQGFLQDYAIWSLRIKSTCLDCPAAAVENPYTALPP